MIYFIIGTKAQFIKMAPVIKSADKSGARYRLILTGQHRDTLEDLADNFGVRSPDYSLYEGPDIVNIPSMIAWATKILIKTYRCKSDIFGDHPNGIVLVHGDTFSTLIGAIMAKIAGLSVGHVESGLRSFNLFHPFPEEITRLIVFSLSDVYFCPGSWALNNLKKFRGRKVDTYKNTLYDSLGYAINSQGELGLDLPSGSYGVVSLHRFENIRNYKALLRVIEIVEYISKEMPLLFILHKPTENKLRQLGLYDRLQCLPNIDLRRRYDYFSFIKLISGAEFIVTDGGSNQEECAYLAKPALLLRKATEREEGLGRNCILSNYDYAEVDRFLSEYPKMKKNYPVETDKQSRPSDIIIESCEMFFNEMY